jgi:hypothetical protein
MANLIQRLVAASEAERVGSGTDEGPSRSKSFGESGYERIAGGANALFG